MSAKQAKLHHYQRMHLEPWTLREPLKNICNSHIKVTLQEKKSYPVLIKSELELDMGTNCHLSVDHESKLLQRNGYSF